MDPSFSDFFHCLTILKKLSLSSSSLIFIVTLLYLPSCLFNFFSHCFLRTPNMTHNFLKNKKTSLFFFNLITSSSFSATIMSNTFWWSPKVLRHWSLPVTHTKLLDPFPSVPFEISESLSTVAHTKPLGSSPSVPVRYSNPLRLTHTQLLDPFPRQVWLIVSGRCSGFWDWNKVFLAFYYLKQTSGPLIYDSHRIQGFVFFWRSQRVIGIDCILWYSEVSSFPYFMTPFLFFLWITKL